MKLYGLGVQPRLVGGWKLRMIRRDEKLVYLEALRKTVDVMRGETIIYGRYRLGVWRMVSYARLCVMMITGDKRSWLFAGGRLAFVSCEL
eukprot:scaffold249309_cov26-Cyclotella_meneghiniana.AAC.1